MLLSFKIIYAFLTSREILLITESFSSALKIYLLIMSVLHLFKTKSHRNLKALTIGMLAGSIIHSDISWIPYHIYKTYPDIIDIRTVSFVMRLGWAFFAIQNQTLILFLDNITRKKFKLQKHHIISIIITIATISFHIYSIIFKYNNPPVYGSNFWLEQTVIRLQYAHLAIIFIPSLISAIKNIKAYRLPKILAHQLKTFLIYLIFPHLILELMTSKIFFPLIERYIPLNEFTIRTISTILISYALYYCCKKMIGLRFLNLKDHVETKHKFSFINDFKDIIEELSYVKTSNELIHITQMFFQTAFNIKISKIKLYIRNIDNNNITPTYYNTEISNKIENFIALHNNFNNNYEDLLLKKYKIFIKDEIEFSNFYQESKERTDLLVFLNNINVDIFLPIYNGTKIITYITVEQHSRESQLFNSTERDEMLVFASYLSNVINLLNYNNLDNLLKQKKEMHEELYQKHQEISQYKESIRSFVKTNSDRKIGIIFYKNRKFTYANQSAKDLVPIDINADQDHYLSKALKQIALQVQQYKSTETEFIKDLNGNKLVLYALTPLEENSVIIMVYYPEVSDVIKAHIDSLKDPTEIDKLLYLETTQSGKLINQLVPSYGDNILNFKVNLLSLALGKKAILLNLPDDDLDNTVELLHHISLKQKLYKIELSDYEKDNEIAIRLFGLKEIFDFTQQNKDNSNMESILLNLDNIGTLFIKNIELLQIETQNYLANFISCGYFNKLKSDHKIFSNIRLIFSSTKNLEYLVSQGEFSKKLYNELNKTSITMPSLLSLTELEIMDLAQGFTEQMVNNTPTKNDLSILNPKDKAKLLAQRPISLEDLKNRVQRLLITKSNKNNSTTDSITFDPAYNISDPIVAKAVRLGKKALKYQDIMTSLWDKYKNQNKIAALLGVDRSSVCRRCQQYNLK